MNEFNQLAGRRKWLPVAITLLAFVALGVSSYLTWATWQKSTVVGCTGASLVDCDEVLSSSGSTWLGIPVSLLGAITYLGILAVVWPAVLRGGWLMTALLTLAMMAAGAGVWFIVSQAFIVQHFCMYCMTVHVCGLLICTAATLLIRGEGAAPNIEHMRSFFTDDAPAREPAGGTALQPVIASVLASIGLAALIGGQMFFAPAGMEVVEDIPLPVHDAPVDSVAGIPDDDEESTVEPAAEPSIASLPEQSAERDDSVETADLFGEPAVATAVEVAEDLSSTIAEDHTNASTVTEDIAETTPPSDEEVAPAEPAGEAVFASDELSSGPSGRETPAPTAVAPADGTIVLGNGLGGRSFEELFGEPPGDTILPAEAQTQAPLPAEAQTQAPTAAAAPRKFRVRHLRHEIDVEAGPVLGNPYGSRRLVEMLDYTCPHCRKLHPFIEAAVERYGDQLGVVIYHVPLSRKCNQQVKIEHASHANACDYARLAYGVWKLAPAKFAEYHDWLMTGERAPPVYDAKRKAMELAGSEVLTDKSIEIESSQRVGVFAADLDVLQVGLPALIYDAGIIKGLPNSQDEWFRVLEQRLGLTPRATTPLN